MTVLNDIHPRAVLRGGLVFFCSLRSAALPVPVAEFAYATGRAGAYHILAFRNCRTAIGRSNPLLCGDSFDGAVGPTRNRLWNRRRPSPPAAGDSTCRSSCVVGLENDARDLSYRNRIFAAN